MERNSSVSLASRVSGISSSFTSNRKPFRKPENGKIHLWVENSKPLKSSVFESGALPLYQLPKRLDVIYSREGYDLKIEETDKNFSVNLELR